MTFLDSDKEKVVVEAYNPDWAKAFCVLQGIYESLLGEYDIRVEHVGSTSVEGLDAKPILDIDIVMHDKTQLEPIIRKLSEVGYTHIGELGIVGRHALRKKPKDVYVDGYRCHFKHNLYVCEEDSLAFKNHIAFRDYLRENPDSVEEYAELKKVLARQFPLDVDAYCEAKTDFITGALEQAGLNIVELETIKKQNT